MTMRLQARWARNGLRLAVAGLGLLGARVWAAPQTVEEVLPIVGTESGTLVTGYISSMNYTCNLAEF